MNAPTRRRRRWARWVLVVVLVAVLMLGGGGLRFSTMLDERGLDAEARRGDTADLEPDVEIVAMDQADDPVASIVLRGIEGAEEPASPLGVQGLRWATGYGRIHGLAGAPGAAGVDLPFRLVHGQAPRPGTEAQLDVRAYPFDPLEAGLDLERISVPGPLGEYPAWLASPDRDSDRPWAIVVHGNSLSPADGLRSVPILRDEGLPTMVASYRNDPGAPPDPSGMLRYGLSEWEDLEAMVRYALDRGSEGVVLHAYSMGGGVVMAFLQRSTLAARVRAVILDAPMLDFARTVDDNALRQELAPGVPLPRWLTAVAKRMATWRFGVDWPALNYLADLSAYRELRFLVFHGTADERVPIATSRAFHRLMPERVRLVEREGAGHIGSWNADPDGYAAEIAAFLGDVLGQATGSQEGRPAS